jgi:hypothetical protein
MTWPAGDYSVDPEDYGVYEGDRLIGWIYRTNITGKQRWGWAVDYSIGRGKRGGFVDSLNEAKAAFTATWGQPA